MGGILKSGQTPIHVMRWAPADYVEDPWVKLAAARGDTGALAFYSQFLNHSHIQGGYLPSEPERLAAALGLPVDVVSKAIPYWTAKACGLVRVQSGRAWNPRVLRDVKRELQFRARQAEAGKKGGLRAGKGRPKGSPNPPSPAPAPAPAPAPTPERKTPAAAASTPGSTGPPPPPAPGPATEPTEPRRARPEVCPRCGVHRSIRQRQDGSGWFCGPILGGCDAKFAIDDPELLRQLSVEVATSYTLKARPELAAEQEATERRRRVAAVLEQCEPDDGGVWDAVLLHVAERVNKHSFATWFRPTMSHGIVKWDPEEPPRLYVGVPSTQFLEWFERNYAGVVWAALRDQGRGALRVWLATPEELRELPMPAEAPEGREE